MSKDIDWVAGVRCVLFSLAAGIILWYARTLLPSLKAIIVAAVGYFTIVVAIRAGTPFCKSIIESTVGEARD